ncbi:hypothetical protein ACJX0J_018243, partial [Zea mays]
DVQILVFLAIFFLKVAQGFAVGGKAVQLLELSQYVTNTECHVNILLEYHLNFNYKVQTSDLEKGHKIFIRCRLAPRILKFSCMFNGKQEGNCSILDKQNFKALLIACDLRRIVRELKCHYNIVTMFTEFQFLDTCIISSDGNVLFHESLLKPVLQSIIYKCICSKHLWKTGTLSIGRMSEKGKFVIKKDCGSKKRRTWNFIANFGKHLNFISMFHFVTFSTFI